VIHGPYVCLLYSVYGFSLGVRLRGVKMGLTISFPFTGHNTSGLRQLRHFGPWNLLQKYLIAQLKHRRLTN
jgi:hypothetical protein